MVGGWNKKDDGASAINSTNIFTALESRRKKSNREITDIEKQILKGSPLPRFTVAQARAPAPVLWADWEDDDDEILAMSTLQPLPSLDDERAEAAAEEEEDDEVESSHGEGSEWYDEVEEGNEENKEPHSYEANQLGTDVNACKATREPGRQLSKKELKKKELAELEAALVELGLNQKIEKESANTAAIKETAANDGLNSKGGAKGLSLAESKSSKKRKAKKEKLVKEGREEEYGDGADEVERNNEANEAHTQGPLDKSEVLKKLSSVKKKKPKEGDSAAKAAAAEAAVRAAKVAAAKKKEKNHYNQRFVR